MAASSCIYEKCLGIERNKLHIVRVFEKHVSQNTVRVYSFRLVSSGFVSFRKIQQADSFALVKP